MECTSQWKFRTTCQNGDSLCNNKLKSQSLKPSKHFLSWDHFLLILQSLRCDSRMHICLRLCSLSFFKHRTSTGVSSEILLHILLCPKWVLVPILKVQAVSFFLKELCIWDKYRICNRYAVQIHFGLEGRFYLLSYISNSL